MSNMPTPQSARHAVVIGWPISQSRSPVIHGYWLAQHDIPGTYTRRAVRPEALATFLSGMREAGLVGCNITLPHKERAYELIARREASAALIAAGNTVWFEGDQPIIANTDTYGFMQNLAHEVPEWSAHDAPAIVLGAGGAARGIVQGLLAAGVECIFVLNRTRERADDLAQHFKAGVRAADWHDMPKLGPDCCLLVNTTSLGMEGQDRLDIDDRNLDPRAVVADVIYTPLETELLARAKARGHRVVDGLGMLLHQAVPGFERWFGVRPSVTPALRARVVADLQLNHAEAT
jgi:shikimate dehydrogenase